MTIYNIDEPETWPTNSIGIYSIRGEYNNFNLVGQTKNKDGFKPRWQKHIRMLRQNKHYNAYIQAAWNKHGEDQFKLVVLESCLPTEDLNKKEIYWISEMASMWDDSGWNLTSGGRVTKFSSVTIERMRSKIFTEEHRKNLSVALTGNTRSLESRNKQANSISKTHNLRGPDGVIVTITNLEKFSRENNLNPSSMHGLSAGTIRIYKGWTNPKTYREKYKTGIKGTPIIVKSPSGEIITFQNMSGAAKYIGVSSSNISYLKSGKFKHCKGYELYENN